jgi:hypothetical protein
MINLRAIANSYTSGINPNVSATLSQSTGSVTRSDGSRVPKYTTTEIVVQVQALSYGDLRQAEGINLQGTRRGLYVNGVVSGIIRPKQKGGDLITFAPGLLPEGDTWLVAHVLEQWPSWAKFIITLQNGPTT